MAENTGQEKTEQATPRKRQKAREEGQVAHSAELNSVVIIAFGIITIYLLGPTMFANLGNLMHNTLSQAPHALITTATVKNLFNDKILTFAVILGPILLSLAVFAYAVNVAQVGFLFSTKAIEPKLDKFNMAKGFKRLVSKRSLVQLIRDVFKTLLIAYIAYSCISGAVPEILKVADKTIGGYMSVLGKLSLSVTIRICLVLLVLALFDLAFQRFDHAQKLKMTKQEIREEMKDTEGNPQIKGRIRQVQREMARRRMISEVPKADVVVTNPTHLAVALQYDSDEMPAPMVIAKGQRLIAEQIKRIARENNVPIVENKPLARSLFKLVDVGQFIPSTLYKATAEVLAYIYRTKEDYRG